MCVPDCEDISSGRLLENGKTDEQKEITGRNSKKKKDLFDLDRFDRLCMDKWFK